MFLTPFPRDLGRYRSFRYAGSSLNHVCVRQMETKQIRKLSFQSQSTLNSDDETIQVCYRKLCNQLTDVTNILYMKWGGWSSLVVVYNHAIRVVLRFYISRLRSKADCQLLLKMAKKTSSCQWLLQPFCKADLSRCFSERQK